MSEHIPKPPPKRKRGTPMLLDVYSVSRLFRISPQVILKRIQARKLPAIRDAQGHYRIDIRDVFSWRRRVGPPPVKNPPGYTRAMRMTGWHSDHYILKKQREAGRIPKRKPRGRDIRTPKRKYLEALGLWPPAE